MGEVVILRDAMQRAQRFVDSYRAAILVATSQEDLDTVEAALRNPPCTVPDWHLARLDGDLARRRREIAGSLSEQPQGGNAA